MNNIITKLMNYKVRIKDEAHSTRIQEWAFKNGFEWYEGGKTVKFQNWSFLYFQFGLIKIGHTEEFFLEDKNIEIFEPWIIEPNYEVY